MLEIFLSPIMYEVRIVSFRTTLLGVCYYTLNIQETERNGSSWKVERRFRDFVVLDTTLRKLYPRGSFPSFPSKSILGYFRGDELRSSRATQLTEYMEGLLKGVERVPKSVIFLEFLGIKDPVRYCRDESQLADWGEADGQIPQDTLTYIMSFLGAMKVVSLGRVSRTWQLSAQSAYLWRCIRLGSSEFERVQQSFLRLLSSQEISKNVEEISLDVDFSRDLEYNLQLTLPGYIHFESVKRFRFTSQGGSQLGSVPPTTSYMCQELLDAILADCSSLESLQVETDISSGMLRTVCGICSMNALQNLRLVFVNLNPEISKENFAVIIECISRIKRTVEILEILVEYSVEVKVPENMSDSLYGHYLSHARFMEVIKECKKLKILKFDFLSASKFLATQDPFPPTLEELEVRFVRNHIPLPTKSVWTHITESVPSKLRVLSLATIGIDGGERPPYFDAVSELKAGFGSNLHSLQVQGPYTGFEEFIVKFGATDFVSRFKSLKALTLINCVSCVTEPLVESLLINLPILTTLVINGPNERLTDSLLVNIVRDRLLTVRTARMKILALPHTRYMSQIGIDAIRAGATKDLVQIEKNQIICGRRYRNRSRFSETRLSFSQSSSRSDFVHDINETTQENMQTIHAHAGRQLPLDYSRASVRDRQDTPLVLSAFAREV